MRLLFNVLPFLFAILYYAPVLSYRNADFVILVGQSIEEASLRFCDTHGLSAEPCEHLTQSISLRYGTSSKLETFSVPITFDDSLPVPIVINGESLTITLFSKSDNTYVLAEGFGRMYGLNPNDVPILKTFLDEKLQSSALPQIHIRQPNLYDDMYRFRQIPFNHMNKSSRTYAGFLAQRAPWADEQVRRLADLWTKHGWHSSLNQVKYPSAVGREPHNMDVRGNFFFTARHKLQHDAEQIRHLVSLSILPDGFLDMANR